MSFLPDLHALEVAAARIDLHATELRSRASLLGAAAATVGWHSSAANTFHLRCDELCRRLRRCADGLEHAAFVLRQHAAAARAHLSVAVDFVESRAELGAELVATGAGVVAHGAESIFEAVF